MEVVVSRFQLPAIVTDNMGSTCLAMTWHDGYVTSTAGDIGDGAGTAALFYSSGAKLLAPEQATTYQVLPLSTGQAITSPGTSIAHTHTTLTDLRLGGTAYPWPTVHAPDDMISRYNYTCGRFFGPMYLLNSMNNYGITMNPRYRDYSAGHVVGRGVHLHGIRFKMKVVFPGTSAVVRRSDYCTRKVSWMLCLLPKGSFVVNPAIMTEVYDGDDSFPPTNWAPKMGTTSVPAYAEELDPLNCLIEVSRSADRYRSFFAQEEIKPFLSNDTCYGGTNFPTPQSRVDDRLRHEWRLRIPLGDRADDLEMVQWMPQDVQVLASGVVEEGNPRFVKLSTYKNEMVPMLNEDDEPVDIQTGFLREPYLNPATGVPYMPDPAPPLANYDVPVLTSAVYTTTSVSTEPMASFEEYTKSISFSKKFDKPLFVDYSTELPRNHWNPKYTFVDGMPYVENATGVPVDVQLTEDVHCSAVGSVPAISDAPAVAKLSLPAYTQTYAGSQTQPMLTAHPITNRIALFVWDNMPRSLSNQFRPRVIPLMHRYETDA